MSLVEKFKQQQFFNVLGQRQAGFVQMISHIEENNHLCNLVETGTARIKGNWSGDGQSTLIWDWLAEQTRLSVTSIDLSAENAAVAAAQTKHVNYIVEDSVSALIRLSMIDEIWCKQKNKVIGSLSNTVLLYLDSFDWNPSLHFESAFHHLAELTAVWNKLPSGCMIVVDDRHNDTEGKHVLVEKLMSKFNIKPIFSGYQIGWIKPF